MLIASLVQRFYTVFKQKTTIFNLLYVLIHSTFPLTLRKWKNTIPKTTLVVTIIFTEVIWYNLPIKVSNLFHFIMFLFLNLITITRHLLPIIKLLLIVLYRQTPGQRNQNNSKTLKLNQAVAATLESTRQVTQTRMHKKNKWNAQRQYRKGNKSTNIKCFGAFVWALKSNGKGI